MTGKDIVLYVFLAIFFISVIVIIASILEAEDEPRKPGCFGHYSFRFPHIIAERDCRHCAFLYDCHEESPLI